MIINDRDRAKKVKGTENDESAILHRVVWKRLSDGMEFEQRLKVGRLVMRVPERPYSRWRGA